MPAHLTSTGEGADVAEALPQEELISSSTRTAEQRLKEALAQAMFRAFIAFLPALAIMAFCSYTGLQGAFSAVLVCAIVLGSALWGFAEERFAPGSVWESKTWLNDADRTWNRSIHYPDTSQPDSIRRIPYDRLALVCSSQGYEGGVSYNVDLCELDALADVHVYCPPRSLNRLCSFDTAQESTDYARTMARQRGIACWQHRGSRPDDPAPRLTRLL